MESSTSYKRFRNEDSVEEFNVKKIKSLVNNKTTTKGDKEKNVEGDDTQKDVKNENEEYHLFRLFKSILNIVILTKDVNEIGLSQKVIPMSHDAFSFSAIDFTKWGNICGYLYYNAFSDTIFTRYKIMIAIKNCKMLELTLKKSDLRIICLGAGPGNDVIGLCSALSELQYPENFRITLVEKFKEWSFCMKLAKILIEEGNFGKVSELFQSANVEMLFTQTDLQRNLTSDKKYFQNLVGADVIVIPKLNKMLDNYNNKECESVFMQSLYEYAQKDVVILLNDTCNEKIWKDFHLVYRWGYKKEDEYKSSALAERKFNHSDAVSSKLPINVLVKKESLDSFPDLIELHESEFS